MVTRVPNPQALGPNRRVHLVNYNSHLVIPHPPTKSDSTHPCVRTALPDPAWRTHYEPLVASTDAATTTATEAPGPVPATRPARQNSLSAETLQTLEKRLAQRPDRQELQDRNILKGAHSSVLGHSYSRA